MFRGVALTSVIHPVTILKECYETEYWIEIAQKTDIISADIAKIILHDCGPIRRMLISSINTAKEYTK